MSYCDKPFQKQDSEISFPCGKCLPCRKRRASSWGFRLMQQYKVSDTAYFITLTYSPETVPRDIKNRATLNKRDLQLFLKKLRKKQPTNDIKYYAVGEYGKKPVMRPHYHLIIFNMYLTTLFGEGEARRILKQPEIYLNGKHEFNVQLWDKGHITIGTVTEASAMYTLKYISKPKQVPQYNKDARLPEFSAISKNLGISYLTKAIKQWHRNDPNERMYVHFQHYKIAMPRYYKERLYTPEEREAIAEYIVNKQKQKRIQERKGTTLKQRIEYVNNLLATKQDNSRKLNKKNNFCSDVL